MRKIKNQFRRFIEFIETRMIFSKYFIIVILLSIVFRLSVILIALYLYCKSYMYVSCNFYSLFRLGRPRLVNFRAYQVRLGLGYSTTYRVEVLGAQSSEQYGM